MAYIFMDESGCLGFDFTKKSTSKNFIITFLCSEEKKSLEKIVKRVFRTMSVRERKRHCGVLHCVREHPALRMHMLKELSEVNGVVVLLLRLDKRKGRIDLKNEKPALYNYATNVLLDRLITRELVSMGERIHFVAAQRETSRFLNENFKGYLEGRNHCSAKGRLDIEVSIRKPSEEKALQVVDFVSWSAFRKFEYGDHSYYDAIRRTVIEENVLV